METSFSKSQQIQKQTIPIFNSCNECCILNQNKIMLKG